MAYTPRIFTKNIWDPESETFVTTARTSETIAEENRLIWEGWRSAGVAPIPPAFSDQQIAALPVVLADLTEDEESGFRQALDPHLSATYAPRSSTHSRQVLPVGEKMRGANVVPKGSAIRDATLVPGRQIWNQMWTEWDWDGWIKPQIDAAHSAGANAIRIIGGVDAVLFNNRPLLAATYRSIPMATFIARTRQWIEYCAELNMYAYPCGGDITAFPKAATGNGPDWTQAELIPLLQEWAAVCDGYSNVMGLDLLQETFYTIDNTAWLPPEVPNDASRSLNLHTWCREVLEALRPHTSLPMTFSHPTNESTIAGLTDTYHLPRAAAYMDFLDFHAYYSIPSETLNYATKQGRPLLIGESGLDKTNAASTRGYFYERVAVVASREEISGAFAWAITDQAPDASPALQYGMFPATYDGGGLSNGVGVGTPEVLAGFATWPTRNNPTSRSAMGFPYTVDPGTVRSSDAIPMPGSNQGVYLRVRDAGWVTKIGLDIAVSSGNLSVAVYANTGSGRSAVPGERLATSGAVASPGTGYREIALTRPAFVRAGDWLFLSADNVTMTFRSLLAAQADSGLGAGRQYRQATAHPAPTTPGTLVATIGATIVLVGVA